LERHPNREFSGLSPKLIVSIKGTEEERRLIKKRWTDGKLHRHRPGYTRQRWLKKTE
jgi:hypothetical protein